MGRVNGRLIRGAVWDASFDPVRGREQAGYRPALIVSADIFNHGPGDLVTVVPMTSRNRRYRLHVPVHPPEGGLTVPSFIMCEQLRVFASERLIRPRGLLAPATLRAVEERLRILLEL